MRERADASVEAAAVAMMDARHVMALATVRADGWPQNTIVGYANDGMTIYFLIFRASQKFGNIARDDRVAIAIGEQPSNIHFAEAVYASGRAAEVTDPDEKERALVAMVDRFFPDRTANLRQSTTQEIKATAVIAMEIEQASAKIRTKGVADDDEDYALPIYAERIPVLTVLGRPEPCPRLLDGIERPASLGGYSEGRLFGDALRDAHFAHYAGG